MRLLATSDLHMQLIDFDYISDRERGEGSLARLAPVIRAARAEADLSLLFDNGDTLQGTPVADVLAAHGHADGHPMARALNHLGYDAVGLGNHDFDHGLDRLRDVIAQYEAPVLCCNLHARDLPMLKSSVILDRDVAVPGGASATLRIGVLAVLPRRTETWNRHQLAGRAYASEALGAAAAEARALKTAGADIVIALAHMGIAFDDEGAAPQNQTVDIAGLPHIDAVVAGHTHLRFPGTDHAGVTGVDATSGMIGSVPVVMPGTGGSHVGQIDLELVHDPVSGWHQRSARVALIPAPLDAPEDPGLSEIAKPAHDATRAHLSARVAKIETPMNTYFALAKPSPVTALIAAAKRHAIARAVAGTALAELPLLAAVSSPATGGFDGPRNFIALEAGPLKRRHIAGLNPYANQLWAVHTNGAQLLDWLERSALIYRTLEPDRPDQPLIDPMVPGFRYDAIFGLTYKIDPTRPSPFDSSGRRRREGPGRVHDVRWRGAPLDLAQTFLVAATDHRCGGGGAFLPFADRDIVVHGDAPMEDALLAYLKAPADPAAQAEVPWQLAPAVPVAAVLQTSETALAYLDEIAELSPEAIGMNAEGFSNIRLQLRPDGGLARADANH